MINLNISDLDKLKLEFEQACRARNGIEMGNAAHKLRCRYGMNYLGLAKLALQNGLDMADYDELISLWDEDDPLDRKSYAF